MSRTKFRNVLAIAALSGAVLTTTSAYADKPIRYDLKIQPQPLATALQEFAKQSGIQIIFFSKWTEGHDAPALNGQYTPETALDALLNGTDLTFVRLNATTIEVQQKVAFRKTSNSITASPSGTLSADAFAQGQSEVTLRLAQAAPATPLPAGPEPADAAPGPLEEDRTPPTEVVVTGSRVARPGFTAPTPVTSIGEAEIEMRAPSTLADTLQSIPSFRGSSQPTTSAITTRTRGGVTADLRGLGAGRTLVLVNNRRFVASGPEGVVDLKAIPSLLIRQIEVVTGGASAAWGSDAVAGVVNFLLKDRISGVHATIQSGTSEHGDNDEIGGSIATGGSLFDDRLKFVFGADYMKSNGMGNQYTRDWGREEVGLITNPAFATNGLPQYIISPNVHPSLLTPGGLITSGPLRGTAFGPNGTTYNFNYGQVFGASMIGGDNVGQNLTNATLLSVPVQDGTSLAHVDFKATDTLNLFGEVSYTYSQGSGQSQQPRDLGTLTVRRDNAYLPTSARDQMMANGLETISVGRLNNDSGAVIAQTTNRMFRFVLGADGALGGDWKWNAYLQQGKNTNYTTAGPNNRITANYMRAIDAVIDPVSGNIVCRSTLTNPANGCKPQNLFGDGSIVVDDYSFGKSYSTLVTKQQVASAGVDGDLFSTWAGPISLAAGAEYRKENVDGDADPLARQVQPNGSIGAFTLGNQFPIKGSYHLSEAYAETVVPLMRQRPMAQALDLNGAVRRTDYSTSGPVTTWKLGLTWEPSDEWRLRATRSHDIRAPNLGELYQDGGSSFTNIFDPVVGQSVQVRELLRGNTNLLPEVADAWTAGVVMRPKWLPRFDLTVDYYKIEVEGVISALSSNLTAARCFAGLTEFCSSIVFNPDGSIAYTLRQSLNLNTFKTSGVDVETRYNFPLFSGTVALKLLGTYVDKLVTVDASGESDLVGQLSAFNRVNGVPHLTAVGGVTYAAGDWTANLEGRYIGSGEFNPVFTEGAGAANTINDNSVPAYVYLSLGLQKSLRLGDTQLQIYGVVNNLLDKDPPWLPSGTVGGANETSTDPVFYDVVGRSYKLGLRAKF